MELSTWRDCEFYMFPRPRGWMDFKSNPSRSGERYGYCGDGKWSVSGTFIQVENDTLFLQSLHALAVTWGEDFTGTIEIDSLDPEQKLISWDSLNGGDGELLRHSC